MIEPVLGSGGCIAPSDEFWAALNELCAEHDWLLCLDEVKTGFGRSGTLLAAERWDLQPDLICLGKALGGGAMPIGALLGSERVLGGEAHLSTGSTWSWLPGSVAAALATLDVYEREDVLGNVAVLEQIAAGMLGELAERHERIGEVRAIGGFLAIEFVRDRETRERDGDFQDAVAAEALRRGVISDSSTTSLNLQPSLLMPPEALEVAIGIVGDVDRRRAREGVRRMSAELDDELRHELEELAGGGVLKTLRAIDSPQGPEDPLRRRERGDLPLLERLPRTRRRSGRGRRGAGGAEPLRRRHRLGAVHLRPLHPPPRARGRPRRLPRDREGDHLLLLLEREPGVARHALRQAHLGALRRAQPRFDHRRHPARATGREGRLRARRHQRRSSISSSASRPARGS